MIGAVFVLDARPGWRAPLLPVDLLRIPAFALSMATSVASFAAQMMAYVALPFYFQDVLHLSEHADRLPDDALADRHRRDGPDLGAPRRPLRPGHARRHRPRPDGRRPRRRWPCCPRRPRTLDIAWRLTLCGLGFGLFQSPNNKVIITSAPRERSGGASGMQSTARLTGQSFGAALVAVIFGLHQGARRRAVR